MVMTRMARTGLMRTILATRTHAGPRAPAAGELRMLLRHVQSSAQVPPVPQQQQQQQQQQAHDQGKAKQRAHAGGDDHSSNSGSADDEETPKYKPGWFSRNPGVTLGGIVAAIALFVYRSSKNKKNFDAVQLPIADEAVISPYEAWELRSANEITPETFDAIRASVFNAFPTGKAAMAQFDRYLGFKLADACPTGLHKSYHLERVLMSLKTDAQQKCDVDALMVAFSLAVKGAADDRLKCLFDLGLTHQRVAGSPTTVTAPSTHSTNETHDAADNEDQVEPTMSRAELERILDLLLETYQIPSEKRVLPVLDEKYPFQQYTRATPALLLHAAECAEVEGKVLSPEEAHADDRVYTFEAFSRVMKSKTVCVWGECFANAKKRMKN